MNEQQPDSGNVALSEGVTLGYLPQEIHTDSEQGILDETLTAFSELEAYEREIEEINQQFNERTDYESEEYQKLIDRLTELHDRLAVYNPHQIRSEAEKVLKGLGFKTTDLQRPMSEFSGGWQMRVELAKLLLRRPSLLLLDEPTNHLDIEAILWLEAFLGSYSGAVMMISHDRMFLDNITNRTIEIVFGRIYDYQVPYSKYLELREERYEQQMATLRNQQKHIAEQERFIERFRYKATKAKQVQSKMKMLEKIDLQELDELDGSTIHFRFPPAPRSGLIVAKAEQLTKSYGDAVILKDLEFQLERGDRIAFVGQNGQGKSTLVKLITEKLEHDGKLEVGTNVELGYYAQIQENTLDPETTVYETIEAVAKDEWANPTRIRTLLGAFLFGEADVDKRVKVLSGGEKSRLALARLLLKPTNLLILDEPTNHLDISSKEVLKDALLAYNGTLVLVSHDRDFLQGLTQRTFEFANKQIKEHLGDIHEFLRYHQVASFREFESGKPAKKATPTKPKTEKPKKETSSNATGALSYAARKERERELRKLKNDIQKREKSISELESAIQVLEKQMQDPDFFQDEAQSKKAFVEHSDLQHKLDQYMHQWETLVDQLQNLEQQ